MRVFLYVFTAIISASTASSLLFLQVDLILTGFVLLAIFGGLSVYLAYQTHNKVSETRLAQDLEMDLESEASEEQSRDTKQVSTDPKNHEESYLHESQKNSEKKLEPEPESQAVDESNADEREEDATAEKIENPKSKGKDDLGPIPNKGTIWKDSSGRDLGVGAKVSFFITKKGETVEVEGILLGEKDGKAHIEVGPGNPLPKNDYSIAWSVVRGN